MATRLNSLDARHGGSRYMKDFFPASKAEEVVIPTFPTDLSQFTNNGEDPYVHQSEIVFDTDVTEVIDITVAGITQLGFIQVDVTTPETQPHTDAYLATVKEDLTGLTAWYTFGTDIITNGVTFTLTPTIPDISFAKFSIKIFNSTTGLWRSQVVSEGSTSVVITLEASEEVVTSYIELSIIEFEGNYTTTDGKIRLYAYPDGSDYNLTVTAVGVSTSIEQTLTGFNYSPLFVVNGATDEELLISIVDNNS